MTQDKTASRPNGTVTFRMTSANSGTPPTDDEDDDNEDDAPADDD